MTGGGADGSTGSGTEAATTESADRERRPAFASGLRSRIPAHILGGFRTTTVSMGLLFVGLVVVYLGVRIPPVDNPDSAVYVPPPATTTEAPPPSFTQTFTPTTSRATPTTTPQTTTTAPNGGDGSQVDPSSTSGATTTAPTTAPGFTLPTIPGLTLPTGQTPN